jgi:hypothetical protein
MQLEEIILLMYSILQILFILSKFFSATLHLTLL